MKIHPFTENATEEERSVMFLFLVIEALHRNPIRFDSVDEYNLFFKVMEDLRTDLGGLDNAVTMEIRDDESVVLRLAEEARPENRDVSQEDYSDEPEFERLNM